MSLTGLGLLKCASESKGSEGNPMGATGLQKKDHRSILIAYERDLMKEGGGGRGTIILIPRDPPA